MRLIKFLEKSKSTIVNYKNIIDKKELKLNIILINNEKVFYFKEIK